jgi:hypothetical protein
MKTQVTLRADAKSLDALAKFLEALERISPKPMSPPKAIQGNDNVIYVEIGYKTDEETFLVGDHMVEIGADILAETGVLVVLAPFVASEARTNILNLASARKGRGEAQKCHTASRV